MAREVTNNLFVFYFVHERDMNRVIEDGPWSFEHSLLLLKRADPNTPPFSVPLSHAEFWIQAYNLPWSFQNKKTAEAIGSFLGEFVKMDEVNMTGLWKPFMRVRVCIDISLPLKRKMKIQPNRGEAFYVDFKYERLPTFCFICGIIGHSERFCSMQFEGVTEDFVRPFRTTFGNANQEHVQGEDAGKKNGSEEGHYPADQSNQTDFVQSVATLNEKHKELTNHLMSTESSSNLGLSQFTYGSNLLEQRKRKVGRTHEESTNEDNMGMDFSFQFAEPKNLLEAGLGPQARQDQ
ncbi:uncharacterized protein LOC116016054 [Ipomoea triloba]|uniref:uncharacterized protein LOC116016054 n=1 Tax=Ipomoea triloba TaxID=35885 RepID=UPI00125CF265|nr:uncharacterized protein LOC116016054 [Ipomoea triloba]